jgi:hypothetical protein
MEWKNLASYLSKFKNISPPGDTIKKELVSILENKLNINIEKKDISIKNNTIILKTNPTIKNEVFLHKTNVLQELNNTPSGSGMRDIR